MYKLQLYQAFNFLSLRSKKRIKKYFLSKNLIYEAGFFSFSKLIFFSTVNSSIDILGIGLIISVLFNKNPLDFAITLSVFHIFLILILLIAAKGFVKVFTSVESNEIQVGLEEELSLKFFSLALNASSEQIQSIGRGKLIALLEDDIGTTIVSLRYLIIGFQALTSFLIFTSGIFAVAGRETAPLILAIITTIIAAFLQRSKSYQLGKKEIKVNASIQQTITDSLCNIKAVRAAQAEDWILKRFTDDMILSRTISRQIIKRTTLFNALRDALVMGILGVWIVATLENLAAPTITTTLLLAYKSSISFSSIINAQRLYLRFIPAYEELCIQRQKLLREDKHSNIDYSAMSPTKLSKKETILSIHWKTDQNYQNNNRSLELRKGKLIAVVGPSGIGKTTTLDLFCGLSGEGKSVWNIQTTSDHYCFTGVSGARQLKRFISYAPQNAVLFEASLRHNLLISREEKIDELCEWMHKLKLGHLLDRETGLDKPLKLAQSPFSGGEVQRLGLLRAWLRDQPIEVLDEPTAFLDKHNAGIVRTIISERIKQKLVLLSTHDPILINQADEVITLQSES